MSSIKPDISFPPFNIETDELIPWPYAEKLLEGELSGSWDHVCYLPDTALPNHSPRQREFEPEIEDARSEASTGSNQSLIDAMENCIAEATPPYEPDIPDIKELLTDEDPDSPWIKEEIDHGNQLVSTENTTPSILRENQFKNEIEIWVLSIKKMVGEGILHAPFKIHATAELKGGNLPTSNIHLLEYVEGQEMLGKVIETHFTQDKNGFRSGMFLSKNAELKANYVLKMLLVITESSSKKSFVIPITYSSCYGRQKRYHYYNDASGSDIKKRFQELLSISGYPLEWLCDTNQTHAKTERPAYIFQAEGGMLNYLKC